LQHEAPVVQAFLSLPAWATLPETCFAPGSHTQLPSAFGWHTQLVLPSQQLALPLQQLMLAGQQLVVLQQLPILLLCFARGLADTFSEPTIRRAANTAVIRFFMIVFFVFVVEYCCEADCT
jgi:hypothetical protein